MIVKAGFNDKPLHIRLSAVVGSHNAELWIEIEGLKDEGIRYETLNYATLYELLDLQNELKAIIAEIVK